MTRREKNEEKNNFNEFSAKEKTTHVRQFDLDNYAVYIQ